MEASRIARPSKASSENARIRLALAASVHFRGLPSSSLDRLAAIARIERYRRDELVHGSGEPLSKFWFVLAGGLRISWPVRKGNEPVLLLVIGVGSFYSVGAFIEDVAIGSICHATANTAAAVIDGAALRALATSDAHIGSLVPRLAFQRLQAILALFADLISAPLRQRIARRLLAQALANPAAKGQAEFALPTSQADLGAMLGSSRSKVSIELRQLEKEGVIRLGYRQIFIRDFGRLHAIAEAEVQPL